MAEYGFTMLTLYTLRIAMRFGVSERDALREGMHCTTFRSRNATVGCNMILFFNAL